MCLDHSVGHGLVGLSGTAASASFLMSDMGRSALAVLCLVELEGF